MHTPLPVFYSLAAGRLAEWLKHQPISQQSEQERVIVVADTLLTDHHLLGMITPNYRTREGIQFRGHHAFDCPLIEPVSHHDASGTIIQRAGALLLQFSTPSHSTVEIPVLTMLLDDTGQSMSSLASVPVSFLSAWAEFNCECQRVHNALTPSPHVLIVGGRDRSFRPTVSLSDVILPGSLKEDILADIQAFFERGVGVYRKLNLKPFRKILLAGAPGTGKTMLCSALAKWAIEHQYLVIYVSGAQGSSFDNIHYALDAASRSKYPAVILLEEMDAYLKPEAKAVILNVLDGVEAPFNPAGTLLIATTNYPEVIDDRLMKRPGRLDRVFIIPEVKSATESEAMLRHYLGTLWRDEHQSLALELVGYTGAFIREVAITALMLMAGNYQETLPLEKLEMAFHLLKEQIEARDDFIEQRMTSTETEIAR